MRYCQMTTFRYLPLLFFSLIGCIPTKQSNIFADKTNQDTVYISSTRILQSNHIPDSVFFMTRLKKLWISGDDCDTGLHDDNNPNDGIKCWMINNIPSEIGNLTELDTLGLTLGAFKTLPVEIQNLKKLKYVNLTDSYMSNIDNLTSLKSLHELLLFGCGLSKLPDNIGDLTNLKFIGLAGNNLDSLELDRIKKALPNCKIYYY